MPASIPHLAHRPGRGALALSLACVQLSTHYQQQLQAGLELLQLRRVMRDKGAQSSTRHAQNRFSTHERDTLGPLESNKSVVCVWNRCGEV